jgi:hypothetical protein
VTPAPTNTTTGPGAADRDEADLLAALADALADQLDAARRGHLDRVAESMERADALIREVRSAGCTASPACRRNLRRLQDQIRLCLAQQQDELVRRRAHLKRGKGTLHTYREAAGGG